MRGLIAAGGELHDAAIVGPLVDQADLVVAADGGLGHLADAGQTPHLVVGDLDSADAAQLDQAVAGGAHVVPYPTDKNETDLELAIDAALARGCDDLVVIGVLGGRIDHTLANIGVLAARALTHRCRVEASDGLRRMWFVVDHIALALPVGAPLALLPWHGDVAGVTSTGVRWPLDNATLPAGSPRGISNVCESDRQTVAVREGVLVVVHDPLADHA